MVHRFLLVLLIAATAITAGAAPNRIPPLVPEPTNVQIPGKIVWADIFTTAPNITARFYSALFDWSTRTITDEKGKYVVLSSSAGPVVGIARGPDRKDKRTSARWIAYFSTTDTAAAVETIETNGGRVIAGPLAIPDRGMHVIAADPEGGLFGLMKSSAGDPADTPVGEGGLLWFNLFARDPMALGPFYEKVAQLQSSPWRADGLLLSTDDASRASISKLGDDTTATTTWVPFFRVASLERKIRLARRLGAKLVVDPRMMENGMQVAVFTDTTGGVFAMAEGKTQEEVSP